MILHMRLCTSEPANVILLSRALSAVPHLRMILLARQARLAPTHVILHHTQMGEHLLIHDSTMMVDASVAENLDMA